MRRLTTLFPSEFLTEHAEELGVVELDLLSALKGEDSHGTAPPGWEFQVCSPIGMTGLLAGPSRRYSYPQRGDSELPSVGIHSAAA